MLSLFIKDIASKWAEAFFFFKCRNRKISIMFIDVMMESQKQFGIRKWRECNNCQHTEKFLFTLCTVKQLNTADQHAGPLQGEQVWQNARGQQQLGLSPSLSFPNYRSEQGPKIHGIHIRTSPTPALEQALCEVCLYELRIGTCPS